jgi:hypothetical protein
VPVTLTARSDANPCPRVDVSLTGLASTVQSVTVWQITDEGRFPVRNGSNIYAVGGAIVTDYEPPLGVPVSYAAEQFDSAGIFVGWTDSSSTTIAADPVTAWFQDPLDPASAVRTTMDASFADKVSETREVKLHRIGDETIALMGYRGLIQGLTMRVYTTSAADADDLRAVLRRTQVLVRTPPPVPIPRALHVVIPTVPQKGVDITGGGSVYVWDLEGDQVTRSSLDIAVPVVTWQRYINKYPTWADFIAAYPTWFDAMKNPPPEA